MAKTTTTSTTAFSRLTLHASYGVDEDDGGLEDDYGLGMDDDDNEADNDFEEVMRIRPR